jgi:hypothetical protein
MEIEIFPKTGDFAENKDIAKEIREYYILPCLSRNEEVILDFINVNLSTQSFIHALISDVFRKHSIEALDNIVFRNCNDDIKTLINLVVEYMQESIDQQDSNT